MAKFKLWMVALTLMMGVSLTSCFESDPTVEGPAFGKVTSTFPSYEFTDPSGIRVTPTNSLASFTDLNIGDYVYFFFSYNSDVEKIVNNSLNASIKALDKVTGRVAYPSGSTGEEAYYENATIRYLGNGSEASGTQFFYFDKNTLILPVVYLAKEDPSKHSFTLVYDIDTTYGANDSEIKFYLRHTSSEEDAKTETARYQVFNMSHAFSDFKNKLNRLPTKVTIYVNESKDATSSSLENKKDDLVPYTVDYSFKDE